MFATSRKTNLRTNVPFLATLIREMIVLTNEQVRNLGEGGNTCLDSPARKADLHKPAGLYPCHRQGGNQVQTDRKLNLYLRQTCFSASSAIRSARHFVFVRQFHSPSENSTSISRIFHSHFSFLFLFWDAIFDDACRIIRIYYGSSSSINPV